MTHRQRRRLLLGLLGFWALTALGVFGFSSEPKRIPLQHVTGALAAVHGERGGARSPGLQVDLKLFEAGRIRRAQVFTPPKNIFGPPGGEVSPSGIDVPSVADQSIAPDGGAGSLAISESTDLRYLGFVKMDTVHPRGPVAVVAEGEDLHIVKVGASIGAYLTVRSISPDQLVVVDSRSRRAQQLPLMELAASESASSPP